MSDAKNSKLKEYLSLIKTVYNFQELLDQKQNEAAIKNYYLKNRLSYFLFHNKQGFMHMGISRSDSYKKEDLLEPLNLINQYIYDINAKNVLEIGAGNGANSIYLAKLNKNVNFLAIDFLKLPLTGINQMRNYKQEVGDYHNLSKYKDEDFDLVFAIETLCHSSKKSSVLKEIYKKLKKGGLFIIFDGYYSKSLNNMSDKEALAASLTEKALAVEKFENIKDFNNQILNSKFSILKKEDLSKLIMPTLRRFEKLALGFYKIRVLAKMIKFIFPEVFRNSIAGLLMPTLIKKNIGCYYLHVLKK